METGIRYVVKKVQGLCTQEPLETCIKDETTDGRLERSEVEYEMVVLSGRHFKTVCLRRDKGILYDVLRLRRFRRQCNPLLINK